jgi:hypothetical protein
VSGRRPWLHFERQGGTPPRDDEELSIADDGAFTARRTIGGPRIGSFEGRLAPRALTALRKAVDSVAESDDLTIPTPRHGATEVLEVGGKRLTSGSNETPAKPWGTLLGRVRSLLEDAIVERPMAAIELVANARSAMLVHGGEAPIDVDLGSLSVRVIRVADEGMVLARWTGRPAEGLVDDGEKLVPTPRWVGAGPGWSEPVPFDHPLELAPGDMLQVWVDVPIREGDRTRAGRLYVPVLSDG